MSLEIVLLGLIHLFAMILILEFMRIKGQYRRLSPETIYIIFSFLHIFYVIYFGFNVSKLEGFVRADFESSKNNIILIIFVKFLADIFYVLTSLLINRVGAFHNFLCLFFSCKPGEYRLFIFYSIFIFFIGIFILLKMFGEIGGFYYYWESIESRVHLLEGLGIYLSFSRNLLQVSVFFIVVYFLHQRKILYVIVFSMLGALLLSLAGSRSSFLFLLFSVFIYCYNFLFPFKINTKLILFFVVSALLFTSIGALRQQQNHSNIKFSDVITSIAPYASQLRRDLTILNYFEDNDFWYGKQYYSLLMAPIPRAYYSEKPVLDGGRYVVAMHQGLEVSPYAELNKLPNYGWPEGNMAGYMNFGWLGFFVFTILSALVVKLVYLTVIYTKNLYLFFVYSYMVFITPLSFDPYALFKFSTYVFVVLFLMVIHRAISKISGIGFYSK